MIKLSRTDSDDPDFSMLVRLLDEYLAVLDGDEHAFYAGLNKTDLIKHVVVAYLNESPVGCGAVREFSPESTEVKRMFVKPEYRGKGIAILILAELERWAGELGYRYCVLETGKRQPEAIALYRKQGYMNIPNYGRYKGVENSVCFEKKIKE